MLSFDRYQNILQITGETSGDRRISQGEDIFNRTMETSGNYKKARVLTQNGWEPVDIRLNLHSKVSVGKNDVDRYIQFRPHVHFPVGTYLIIEDENDDELMSYEEILDWYAPENYYGHFRKGERSQLWMIANRDDSSHFVKYNVLRTNWNFRWMNNGKIENCIGVMRMANSYSSGTHEGDRVVILDDLLSALLPNTYLLYGENLAKYGLSDTRAITYDSRFIVTHNSLHPTAAKVTKIVDTTPQGITSYTFRQTEFNPEMDDAVLMVCDYKNSKSAVPIPDITEKEVPSSSIRLGETLEIKVSSTENLRVILDKDLSGPKPDSYYENMLKITVLSDDTISIKASKAGSLIGKRFTVFSGMKESLPELRLEVLGFET